MCNMISLINHEVKSFTSSLTFQLSIYIGRLRNFLLFRVFVVLNKVFTCTGLTLNTSSITAKMVVWLRLIHEIMCFALRVGIGRAMFNYHV